jgi:hypothetical protein
MNFPAGISSQNVGQSVYSTNRDTTMVDPTTICFKNVPSCYSRQMVFELLDSSGFKKAYDFIYVPHSIKRLPKFVNLGYFFVNFVSHEVAVRAWERFAGFKEWVMPSDKIMVATWAARTQGQKACIERFQNSRVVLRCAAECGPAALNHGVVVPVDPPRKTKMLGDKPSEDFPGKPLHEPDESSSTADGCESATEGSRSRSQTWDSFEDGVPISLAQDSPVEECRADATDVISREEASAKEECADDEVGVPGDFSWMPDESACSCTKCEEPFTLFRRRHHCRACADICCAECAPRTRSTWSKLSSLTLGPTFKRVCKDCAQGLKISPQGPVLPGALYVKNTFIDVKRETYGSGVIHTDTCPF